MGQLRTPASSRWRWAKRLAFALAPLALVGAACGVVQLRRTARITSASKALEAAMRPLIVECRWERPVVGGAARDCNGVDEARLAAQRLFADAPEGMMTKASLLEGLEQDRPLPADVSAFVASHGEALTKLREATRCSWACTRTASPGSYRRGTVDQGGDLLLFTARVGEPQPCMSIALDVTRLVLDGQTGLASAFPDAHQARRLHEARRTLLECARRASAAALEEAARQAAVIATTTPPVGDALGASALIITTALLEDAAIPDRADVPWFQRGALLDVGEAMIARLDRFRGYREEDLPAAFDRLPLDLPARPWVPFVEHTAGLSDLLDLPKDLRRILRGRAHLARDLHAMAVALAAQRDRATSGAWSDSGPPERARPELRDPFTGKAFGWVPSPSGPIVLAEAVGDMDAEALGLLEPIQGPGPR